MRRLFALTLAVALAGCASSSAPTIPPAQRAVEARLADMLAAAAAPQASPATLAPFFVVRNQGPSRDWKVALDPARPDEQAAAASGLELLRGILADVATPDGGLDYEVLEFVVQPESEGVWHVLMVEFAAPRGPVEMLFAFLPVGGTYLLGDIDD